MSKTFLSVSFMEDLSFLILNNLKITDKNEVKSEVLIFFFFFFLKSSWYDNWTMSTEFS